MIDIRKHRFVAAVKTCTKVILDKKTKQRNRRHLNNPKNWWK